MIAYMTDGSHMQDVLLLEAWGPVDGSAMETKILPNVGKILALDKAKVVLKGKSLTFGNKAVKVLFDAATLVSPAAEDAKYPMTLPTLELPAVQALKAACVGSFRVIVTEPGAAVERDVKGAKKLVANFKVAVESTSISVAFCDKIATSMAAVQEQDFYILDWIVVVPRVRMSSFLLAVAPNAGNRPGGYARNWASRQRIHKLVWREWPDATIQADGGMCQKQFGRVGARSPAGCGNWSLPDSTGSASLLSKLPEAWDRIPRRLIMTAARNATRC